MIRYPHKTDEEIVRENLEFSNDFLEKMRPDLKNAKAQKNGVFFKMLGQELVYQAQYAYALEEPMEKVHGHLTNACGHLAHAADYSMEMDVFEYMDFFGAAVVAGDAKFAKRLAALQRPSYTSEGVDASEISFVAAEILAGLLLGKDQELSGNFQRAERELKAKGTGRYDKIVTESLIAMSHAIVKRDQAHFDQALTLREKDFKRRFGGPDDRDTPGALLDINGLALVRLAAVRGLAYQSPSAYRPVQLLQVKS